MSEATLEHRVEMLEQKVAELTAKLECDPPEKDWRSTVGMFAADPVMRDIQEEGQRIREDDRRQAERDDT